MDVYQKADLPSDVTNKARILGLLRAFPPNEPSKKKFVAGVVE